MHSRKAFTLVELLVVVGILGILMAVLLGTFGGAGESARAAKCQANLHNLALAVQSHAMTDSDNRFPSSKGWIPQDIKTPYDTNMEQWNESLDRNGFYKRALNRSRESYFCPTHQKYAREHNLGGDPLWSYAMNKNASGRKYGSIGRADHLLLFAELPFANVKNGDFVQSGQIAGEELDSELISKNEKGDSGGNEVVGFNHKNGKTLVGHVCYADGHVAKLVAPKAGDVQDLTMWLCFPANDEDGDIDVSFDGTQYKKVVVEE